MLSFPVIFLCFGRLGLWKNSTSHLFLKWRQKDQVWSLSDFVFKDKSLFLKILSSSLRIFCLLLSHLCTHFFFSGQLKEPLGSHRSWSICPLLQCPLLLIPFRFPSPGKAVIPLHQIKTSLSRQSEILNKAVGGSPRWEGLKATVK